MKLKTWYNNPDFQSRALDGLITLLILYIIYALSPLFLSIAQFVILCIYPFLIAIVLYYLLRPLVRLLQIKLPTWLSILLSYVVLIGFIVFVVIYIYPTAEMQMDLFLKFKQTFLDNEKFKGLLQGYALNIGGFFFHNLSDVVQMATDFIVVFFIVPFVVFYLLKDDQWIYEELLYSLKNQKVIADPEYFLHEIDANLTSFFSARVLISLIVSILLLVAFFAMGINYPVLLFLTSFLFYIIPTIGFLIAAIPPLVVGFSMSNVMGIEVIIVMTAATILEGSLLSPKILGDALYIHPLTVIFVLWIAGLLFGIVGLIFATPLYLLLKVTLKHLRPTVKIHKIK